jgi:hypothetical protein
MEGGVKDEALRFVEMFEASEQASDTARQNSEQSRDYYDNKQWTAEEIRELQRRGQPVIIDNVIAGKVNWLLGQEMSTRTDPKAFPRTPQHEKGAEAITDAVRYVCDNQEWNSLRSKVWENMLIEGYGGVEVIHRMARTGPEIVINHYGWDRLFFDPHSRKGDFSDARYRGAVIWQDRKVLEKQYPKVKAGIEGAFSRTSTLGETYEDRPHHQVWGDKDRGRVRVVLMHYLEDGVWRWIKFSYGVVLEEGESPYTDEDGQSVCPLIMQSAYIDRENNRYGEVHKLITQQDEINKRRSKLLHMANSRQTMGEKGAVNSVAAMKRELAKPDGHVEYEPGENGRPTFQVLPVNDMASSQFALLQEAKQSIQEMGASEALMGSADGDSGRAVLAKQQGAMQAITPLNDKLHQFTRRVFEAIWQRIRQFWTEEKWVRVTDDENNVRFVGLNKPITLAEELRNQPFARVQEFALRTGLIPNDPRLGQTVRVENNVAELEVDLIMQEVPDTVTLEAETFEHLVNLDAAKGGVLPIELLIEASPLRSSVKEKILKHFKDQSEQQSQGQQQGQQLQEQMMQAEMAEKAAGVEETQSRAHKNRADAAKSMIEGQQMAVGIR